MRAVLGPALLHFGFLGAGLGILRALGVVRAATPARWAAAGGVAYLAGLIGTVLVCIGALVVGVPLRFGFALVVCLVLSLPFLLELRPGLSRSGPPLARPRLSTEQWIAAIALGAFALVVLVGVLTVGAKAIDQYDAWHLWTRKAILLFDSGDLPLDVFGKQPYATIHPDYPLLLPVLEALHFRSMGRVDTGSVHLALWLQLAAFVWAAAYLAAGFARPAVWALIPAAAAIVSVRELLSAYADVPLGYLLCLGALALGSWLERGRRSDLVLASIFLAGAASMKNEGLVGFAVAFFVAFVVVARRDGSRLVALGGAALAAACVAILPWRLWLAANDISGDIPVGKGLDPTFLFSAERWDRVWPSLTALHGQLATFSSVAIFVPLALALLLLGLRKPSRSPVAGFYLGTGILYALSLVWAYWISPLELEYHITHSVDRIYVGVAFIAAASVVHLCGATRLAVEETP